MVRMSPKQIQAYRNSQTRITILEGAVRSGKSFVADILTLEDIRSGPPGPYVICGKNETTIVRNIIEPLQELTNGVIRYNRGLGEFTLFGRKVYCVGANDERAEGKIRGATFAGALVDEVSIIPQGFFKMLLSRLSIDGAKLRGTTNPDSPYHWLKTDFIDRKDELDLTVHSFTLDDNPSLTDTYKNNLKKEFKGLWYKRFIEGKWVLAEGSIYDFFDTKLHVVNKPPHYAKEYYLGIDYGTANAFSAVLLGFNDDYHPALVVEKEYYWDSKKMGGQKTDSEYALDIKREFGGYPIRLIYLDPSAASFEVELKRAKLPCKQANNDVLDGIRTVGKYLAQGDLVICRSCVNLIKEIEGYVWDEKAVLRGEEKPVKQHDHAVDSLRYVIHTHFGKRTTLKPVERKKNINPMQYPGWGPHSYGWQNGGSFT